MKKIISLLVVLLSLLSLNPACAVDANASGAGSQGLNTFAFNLFRKMQKPGMNIVFSPYSLSSLLAVLVNGAGGKTQAQLMKVLNIDTRELQNINAQADKLTSNTSNFLIANALWGDKSFAYKQSFTDLMSTYPSNHFHTLDFAHNAHAAVNTINNWVDSETHGYITQIVSDKLITAQTRLVLTNAIFFKGLWTFPFEKSSTEQKPFTLIKGGETQVPMMTQEDNFSYAENSILQLLLMTYSKSSLAMAILLPKAGHTLVEVQKSMNADSFAQLINSAAKQKVIVSLPRFKLESTFGNLTTALQSLGLKDAFNSQANFSNMTKNRVYISGIIQKALIHVDEEGTVAAAATTAVMAMAVYIPHRPPTIFNANHPFMFVLYDQPSKTILFLGQVIDPGRE